MHEVIVLTEVEQKIAKHVGKERDKANRKGGVQDKQIGEGNGVQINIDGMGAELAFCRLFNLYPDFTTHLRNTQTDTGDAQLWDGRWVDVKTTRYPHGKLVVAQWKRPTVDLFALMVGTFPEYKFCGVIAAAVLLQEKRLGTLGHGLSYLMEQHQLLDLVRPRIDQQLYTNGPPAGGQAELGAVFGRLDKTLD